MSPGLGPPSATLIRRGRSENGHLAGQSPDNFGNSYRPDYPTRYTMAPAFPPGGSPACEYAPGFDQPNTVLTRLVLSDSTGFASPSTLNTPRDWQPQTPNDPGRNAYGGPPPPQPSPLQQSSHDTQASASSSPAPGTVPGSSQPSLMRTSQLAGGPATMNTYVISNAKASLQLQQDLNLMAVGW